MRARAARFNAEFKRRCKNIQRIRFLREVFVTVAPGPETAGMKFSYDSRGVDETTTGAYLKYNYLAVGKVWCEACNIRMSAYTWLLAKRQVADRLLFL
jgi:hypothetical protein